jgi:CheY-like chemotaxis protein
MCRSYFHAAVAAAALPCFRVRLMRPVLHIEDNEQNRYLIGYLLEASGYHVVHACDGPAGIRLALQINPQLVLLDIRLPGMDGYAVSRALRTHPALADVPFIAVTSHAMPGDRDKALAAGCQGYVEKPINPATFVTTIRQYLDSPAKDGAT